MDDHSPQGTRSSGAKMAAVADIATSYLANHHMDALEVPLLLTELAMAFDQAQAEAEAHRTRAPAELKPAADPRKSAFPDHLVCLECGKAFQGIKRHLRTSHNLTPEAYRTRWGLPPEYPMVAPLYSERRSKIARDTGLGKA